MCYPVSGMMHIKDPLLLIEKSSPCCGSGFPFLLSEWSFTIIYVRRHITINVLSASLNKTLPSFVLFQTQEVQLKVDDFERELQQLQSRYTAQAREVIKTKTSIFIHNIHILSLCWNVYRFVSPSIHLSIHSSIYPSNNVSRTCQGIVMTLCIICFPSSGQGMSASVCYACIINTTFFFLEGIDLNKQKKTEKQWLLIKFSVFPCQSFFLLSVSSEM